MSTADTGARLKAVTETLSAEEQARVAPTTPEDAAALAAQWGLQPIGHRPPLPTYLRLLWQRRHFAMEFARAREQAQNSESRLGQLWQVLNPMLNAAVFFLIFGVILNGKRNIPNYIAFLVIGVFLFTFTQNSIMGGARSVASNLGLIRALDFPRAVLPLSYTVEELYTLGTSLIIVVAIVLITGEPVTPFWLLIIPAVVLQTLFNLGLALIFARMTARVRDIAQLLPFIVRTWMYMSGVFFSIHEFAKGKSLPVKVVLELNPAAVYIEIIRACLLDDYKEVPLYLWVAAVVWALLFSGVGLVYFWKAEEKYGRG